MLGRRLPRHRNVLAELAQGLAVVLVQPVQQTAPGRVGQRLEHRVQIPAHTPIMQVITCMSSGVSVALLVRGPEGIQPGANWHIVDTQVRLGEGNRTSASQHAGPRSQPPSVAGP
jgi:hypothetical protein